MANIVGTTGTIADVNDFKQLEVSSVERPHDHWKNERTGEVWSAPFSIAPSATGKKFFYLKNTGTKALNITDVRLESTVVGRCEVIQVTGTAGATAAVAITPVSRNTGKTPVLTSTITSDTDVTTVVTAGTWFYIPVAVTNTLYHLRTTSNIIIAPGTAMALNWVGATATITGVVSIAIGD